MKKPDYKKCEEKNKTQITWHLPTPKLEPITASLYIPIGAKCYVRFVWQHLWLKLP
jgi:hypothetical protein